MDLVYYGLLLVIAGFFLGLVTAWAANALRIRSFARAGWGMGRDPNTAVLMYLGRKEVREVEVASLPEYGKTPKPLTTLLYGASSQAEVILACFAPMTPKDAALEILARMGLRFGDPDVLAAIDPWPMFWREPLNVRAAGFHSEYYLTQFSGKTCLAAILSPSNSESLLGWYVVKRERKDAATA